MSPSSTSTADVSSPADRLATLPAWDFDAGVRTLGFEAAKWADDPANTALLLAQIADVPDERRGAAFVCAATLVTPDGGEWVLEREWRGRVVREPRGTNGFGYDPVFVPDGLELTSAELVPAEKDARSHRAQAFAALVPVVAEALGER